MPPSFNASGVLGNFGTTVVGPGNGYWSAPQGSHRESNVDRGRVIRRVICCGGEIAIDEASPATDRRIVRHWNCELRFV